MKLKYYMRGLGIGIAVTSVILIILSGRESRGRILTNEEVIARAEALGMTRSNPTLLEEIGGGDNKEEELSSEAEPLPKVEDVPTVSSEFENTKEEEEVEKEESEGQDIDSEEEEGGDIETSPEEMIPKEEIIPEEENPGANEGEIIEITIPSGTASYGTCKILEDAGIIDNAGELDQYFYQHGYDVKIRAGKYQIPKKAQYEEIVDIMIGRGQ